MARGEETPGRADEEIEEADGSLGVILELNSNHDFITSGCDLAGFFLWEGCNARRERVIPIRVSLRPARLTPIAC